MRFIQSFRKFFRQRIRFDRNEFSGAFGDIGTVLPLIIGIILVTGIDGSRVFIVFGIMQMMTALVYGIPMPVQPLKAAALIVITQKVDGKMLFGGGIAIGITMLAMSLSGLIDLLARIIPKSTVRGIQLGLGLQLVFLAMTQYIPSSYLQGNILAGLAVIIMVSLIGNRKIPPALALIILGTAYILLVGFEKGIPLPESRNLPAGNSIPGLADIVAGFLLLAIPQIPLSLGNSIYATSQLAQDYFRGARITPVKISITYSLMNIISPVFGGIPVCHGSGGMAGHHLFGARTGGSVFICGMLFIMLGIVFGADCAGILSLFPRPILGVILLFEGMSLVSLIRDMAADQSSLVLAIVVGVMAVSLPYGYVAGMTVGILAHYILKLSPSGVGDVSG